MNMIRDYYLAKDGHETIVTECGFLSYAISGKQFYIAEFFVATSHQQSSKEYIKLMRLAYDVAVKNLCEYFAFRVHETVKNFNTIVKTRIKMGFKVTHIEDRALCFRMELAECPWIKPRIGEL